MMCHVFRVADTGATADLARIPDDGEPPADGDAPPATAGLRTVALSDYDVLVALSEWGPQRINDLGEALAWEQSRLSHQLRRMRGRGLVDRRGSGDDRRGATVELTDSGRAALDAAAPGHAELVRSVLFDGLSAAQQRAFGSVIESVVTRLTS